MSESLAVAPSAYMARRIFQSLGFRKSLAGIGAYPMPGMRKGSALFVRHWAKMTSRALFVFVDMVFLRAGAGWPAPVIRRNLTSKYINVEIVAVSLPIGQGPEEDRLLQLGQAPAHFTTSLRRP
jgi:hypothetical protein